MSKDISKDIEIGQVCGVSIYMKPEELLQITAMKEFREHKNKLIEDNAKLVYKLGLTIEALNKILDRATKENKSGVSNYAKRVCQNVLKKVVQ